MKTLLLLLTLSLGLGVRYLRWFAFLQQKEYRADRLKLFISTSEGKAELLRLIPQRSDFTKPGCKRPKLTARMVIVMLTAAGLTVIGLLTVSILSFVTVYTLVLSLFVYILFLYVFAPLVVFVSSIPTSFVARAVTVKTAKKAKELMDLHEPAVIGITGSYGKSSTKVLLYHLLATKMSVFSTPKSYNTLLSIARSVVAEYTGQSVAIIEYGAYVPGEIQRITKFIRPQTAIVTGFAPQHLGLFGSEEKIIDAKAELVSALKDDEHVYVNGLSDGAQKIAHKGSKDKNVHIHSVVWKDLFSDVSTSAEGKLTFKYQNKEVTTQIVGKHYIENLALAWSVALQYLSEKELVSAVESFQPSSSFVQAYRLDTGVRVIDDGGSSNPRGFEEAIALLESLKAGTKIVITPGIVDLGQRSAQIHTQLAEKLLLSADLVLYVGEAGKTEMKTVLEDKCIDDQDAIISILQELEQDGIVLIEGRMPAWVQSFFQNKMRVA